MTNYIQRGDVVTLTAPYTVTSGSGALVGSIFGVAVNDTTNATSGEFLIEGVVSITKDTSTFSQGDLVYWDDSAKKATSTTSTNKLIGVAVAAAATGVATLKVRLNGAFVS